VTDRTTVSAPAGDHTEGEGIRILGVRVDCLDMASALVRVEGMVEGGGPLRLVATVNPEFVMRARGDDAFRRILDSAALCLADGIGVVWAMRRQGCRDQKRVAGSDLVPRLAELCARRGWRPFLPGAQPGVAEEAARRLEATVPGLRVAGCHAGSPWPEDDEESLRRIEGSRADLLLVAYGHPRQEFWIDRNRHRLKVAVAVGVGGALDFLAGRRRRAPAIMRRAHLEWLWRLMLEPWRARRMAVLPLYALAVLRSRAG
jgi:N-acetylglucosaminyldiphosphoundecaprenol N-acetyl-beta-D-mannosaminyltransferase